MNKVYSVKLFDQEDGGHLLGEALFSHTRDGAIAARNEFNRLKKLCDEGYTPYIDSFNRYANSTFNLRLDIVEQESHIKYFDRCECAERKPNIKHVLDNLNYVFEQGMHNLGLFSSPKDVYNAVSSRFDISHIEYNMNKKSSGTAEYEINLKDFHRKIFVFADFRKKRFVISGQPWHGYIMPDKTRSSWGKKYPAVWFRGQR